ncbi:MAG: EamA family transporter [Kordiimonadaceae bacterium]|nr:EamA family transporter [Kordiimonadaceae bacterium]MBO6567238.1 EamA family transporter [Kordiimonadaceae bacterium]MBO6963548.1 EamA family transporter [Kordiimonadaceae bacterium]
MPDASLATALILFSALLHASWNAVLKSGKDRQAMIGVLNVSASIVSLPMIFLVPTPSGEDWTWIGISVAVHLAYQLSLARMMDSADYSLVYPISRGLGPLVVTAAALLLLGEPLGAGQILAIFVIIAGAVLAGFASADRLRAPPLQAVFWACLVGLLIGVYTSIDGSAVKRMSPLTFLFWSNLLIMPPMMAFLYRAEGTEFSKRMIVATPRALVMTFIAYCGYTLALFAFRFGNLAEIAALRETSILFAAVIGGFWLKERITVGRLIGIAIIAVGAIALKSI